jgi:subtilase family serine protease
MPEDVASPADSGDPRSVILPTIHRAARRLRHGAAVAAAGGLAAVLAALPAAPAPGTGHAAMGAGAVRPVPAVAGMASSRVQLPAPELTSRCLTSLRIRCYTPVQYRQAYNLNGLYSAGITGQGRTIVIVDSFGSPTIRTDIHVFDRQFGFPDPGLRIIHAGQIPAFNPANSTQVGWANETTLDVEYAHSIAPGARIVLVETPVAETEGVTGFPEMMTAEKALIDRGVGDVISQSFGATENTFPGFGQGNYSSLLNLRYAFTAAASHHVTVLAASGDDGATNAGLDGVTLYPKRVNSWPSSDPLVTSVGGSQLYLDNAGNPVAAASVWNDGFGAGGGGQSAVFGRPAFQSGVRGAVGDRRGTPDISMSAAVNGGCWVYESFSGRGAGWEIFGGTSEATPIFAGIVALADQVAGHRLGDINPALYLLGMLSHTSHFTFKTGIVDITAGSNSFAGVTGFAAGTGYDLASGWGTIDAGEFVRALARR